MKKGLSANTLKLVAIFAMTVDHIAWMLYPEYDRQLLPLLMHAVGRITCPIMCFCLAEGYHHTRSVEKYTARLFACAFVSHFAYLFCFRGFGGWKSFLPFADGSILNQTSVLWSLAWGLVMLRIGDSSEIRENRKPILIILICLLAFPGDWSCIASLWILAFGTNRGDFRRQMGWLVCYAFLYALVYMIALDVVYGLLQMAVVLAIPLLKQYNGQRGFSRKGNEIMKWLFYLYYPVHLLVLGWMRSAG